jgi:4-hydroxythreonine-4-phosphate dehydrogenase
MSEHRIKIGITSGDPHGVGPEIIIKALADHRLLDHITTVIYANPEVIKAHKKAIGGEDFPYNTVKSAADALPKKVNLVNVWKEFGAQLQLGKADKEAGQFAFKSLEAAVADLASNKIDALVTAPINKDTIQSKDFQFPGHTEYLAKFAQTEKVLMFLVSDMLRVGIVTGHVAIKDVAQHITKEKIMEKLHLMHDSLIRDFGVHAPKIAVLGLNPHAGDNGLLGTEEKEIILPAVREANDKGMYVYGPYGADGFFGNANYRKFDAVLAMYHDQGLTPFKALAFESGVNFTAGLPVVRTSPDHGTSFDIAGQGKADESSFRAAIYAAADIYNQRKNHRDFASNPLRKQEVKDSRDDQRE